MSPKFIASFEMFISTVIWGFGFVATRWALESVDTVSMTVFRFCVAGIIGIGVLLLIRKTTEISAKNLRLSCGPGLLLGFMIITQTWGLELTSVTNSGFITTLYVVFVPIIEFLLFGKRSSPILLFWIALALIGTAFMAQLTTLSVNAGDLLTLACALLGAGQIVWVGRVSSQISSPFAFNVFQSFWGAMAALIFVPFYPKLYFTQPTLLSGLGILSVTIGSTLLAFALQVRAQRILPATTASLFFLFESPFAAFFATILLSEPLIESQWIGGLLIFASAIGATLTSRK